MKKILVLNLTPRWWMLHYSSQFCNELSRFVDLRVAIASYYNENIYSKNINFIKIKTNPNLISFIFDTLFLWNHIIFIYKIIKFKPNVVHFIDNHPWYLFYSKLFKLLWYTIFVTQHDPTLHSWECTSLLWKISIKVNKTLRNISNKIFVHWDKLKNEITKNYWVPNDKVISIFHWNYNFLKDNFSKGWAVEKNTFLFFWRIVDYKWLDLLLDSLTIIKSHVPDFKLIIAWPWDLSKYSSLLNKFSANIEIFNYNIESEDIFKYFERAEFVVLPYKDATWSWIIPISYAFSKPVIVTNVWELASVVLSNETGLIIEKNNVAKLAESIIFMLTYKENTVDMWKNWRKFSDEKLWWETIAKMFYELV